MHHPITFLIKPASGSCNLRCKYCFYADEMKNRKTALYGRMSGTTLEALVEKGMDYADQSVSFAFQGGEPTLMGLDFFKAFCKLKDKYNTRNLYVNCAIQTNGMLLDKDWASFFAHENFLVGLSIDGPKSVHDKYRLDAEGNGTLKSVLHSAEILSEAGADFNVLTVLTEDSAKKAGRIYNFLMDKGFMYQQYIPCIEPFSKDKREQNFSLTAESFGAALKLLFDLWFSDVARSVPVHNRYFENLVGILAGREPESCDMRGCCSVQYVVEADGGVYPCDFYALDKYKLGNIINDSIEDIDKRRLESGFIKESMTAAEECSDCRWKNICRGGCRRNRDVAGTAGNSLGLNRYCKAYKIFFPYAIERLRYLADSTYKAP